MSPGDANISALMMKATSLLYTETVEGRGLIFSQAKRSSASLPQGHGLHCFISSNEMVDPFGDTTECRRSSISEK